MANRNVLSNDKIDPSIAAALTGFHSNVVREVEDATKSHKVVVVGMAGNPFVKRVRKALEKAGVPFHFISYGGYMSKWKERLAIKLWSGWPTFPQVFVKGVLVGGCQDTEKLLQSGELQKRT